MTGRLNWKRKPKTNKDMKNLFVPYKIAVIAKENGFDEPCLGFFNGYDITMMAHSNKQVMHRNTFLTIKGKENFVYTPEPPDADTNPEYERLKWGIKVTAPLYQQLVDWFREEHGIFIAQDLTVFDTNAIEMKKSGGPFGFCRRRKTGCEIVDVSKETNYYQALTKALEEAFKLI